MLNSKLNFYRQARKLATYQKKTYKKTHTKFMKLWKDYSDGNISVKQLLRGVAHINGPVIDK